MGSLVEKVAIVTGSGRGIGRAIAEAMLHEGAKIVITDINEELCQQTVSELSTANNQVLGITSNVTVSASVEKMVEHVENFD